LEKHFQFELHTSESQDCSVEASKRLVSKKLHIEEQFQVEGQEEKREIHIQYIEEILKYLLLSVYYQSVIENI